MSDQIPSDIIAPLIEQERLPDDYADTAEQVILPLAHSLYRRQQRLARPLLVGINGAQGTGKSTLSLFLKTLLTDLLACPCVAFSLDDIYLTLAERERLASEVHPLLLTRGVPGTHDLVLGQQLLDQLITVKEGEHVAIPVFDKASDDRAAHSRWRVVEGPVNVILVEGWCLGAMPEADANSLAEPLNELEQHDDHDGCWRQYVNQRLDTDYREFFGQLDCLVMLKAPSMDCVLEWRTLQEHKLAQHRTSAPKECGAGLASPSRIMSDQEVRRFVMHYERITRASLAEMPARADILIEVDDTHRLSTPILRAE